MSDSADELLSKADALLSRWRNGWPPAQSTADYPVLTDVVESPALNGSHADRPHPAGEPALAEVQSSAAHISALEARVRQRVLEAIEGTIPRMVADTVQGRLEEIAKELAAELTGQVREHISELVRDAVGRALERELTALPDQSTGK